jgi:hypothetical protein
LAAPRREIPSEPVVAEQVVPLRTSRVLDEVVHSKGGRFPIA